MLPFYAQAANPQVVISTNLGDIVVELYEQEAPVTVANFLQLVDSEAYKDTIFHRVIAGFMIQAGGHYLDLSEAPEVETIFNEAANGLKNRRGTLAMARQTEIDSASRQFFINVDDNSYLDHDPKKSCTREDEAAVLAAREKGLRKLMRCKSFGYAVFGEVIEGMDVVDLIELIETQSVSGFDDVPVTPVVILSTGRLGQSEEDAET
ncbi:MAG: peptidylprolyl isomerase [Pseudomonadales bacterium]|jgi:peptidyl-prolyl cis-trans isomerase A (cyclophilin A)|nr:peptidylprolyl isomerase [Pseudomonadales bacterium]